MQLSIDYYDSDNWWRATLHGYAIGSGPTITLALESLQRAIDRRRAEDAARARNDAGVDGE